MKNLNFLKQFAILMCLILNMIEENHLYSQATVDINVPTGGAYLGWDAGQNLELRTNNLTHMQMMQTGNTTINGFSIDYDGFVGISQDPVLFTSGLGTPFSLLHLNGDNGGGALTNGYRDWMRFGLTYTHNRDMMYVGQREMGDYDITDAVIAWADNSGESNGPDNLCFVFTAGNGTNPTPTDPQSILGRETARMTGIGHTGIGIRWTNALQPKRTLDVVRHESVPQFRITRLNDAAETGGIYTDFETSGLGHLHILPRDEVTKNVGLGFLSTTSTPTERLDVYAGTARLRQVPDNAPHVIITGVKQDVSPTDGDYVLNYLSFPQDDGVVLAGDGTWITMEAADCDWEVIENVPGIDDVVTGHGDDCYPAGHAGVGTTLPQAKLEVIHSSSQVNPKAKAINALWDESTETFNSYAEASAIHGTARRFPGAILARGVWGESSNARYTFGGDFRAYTGPAGYTAQAVGVRGRSLNTVETQAFEYYGGLFEADALTENSNQAVYGVKASALNGTRAYGIYASGSGANIENWAGFFVGDVWCSTNNYLGSDAALKQNVEPIESALGIIRQIEPKRYEFLTEQYSQMNLPTGIQQSVIAQELEEVLPSLVKATTFPAQYDTLGNVVSEAVEFKSVNYTGLIPYLIAGMKEQQAIIESQNEVLAQMMEQLASMQQQINQCCNANDGTKSMPGGTFQPQDLKNEKSSEGGNELYQNIPNPFRESTTISYQLEFGGRVQLSIYDGNGKVVTTLVEANQPNGRHSAVWNANGMPAGVYHYALYVNGELLVKRAIKLQE